jgi:hypothetical protein
MSEEEQGCVEQPAGIRPRVSLKDAQRLLERVEHEKFRDALGTYWQPKNFLRQSICWLFCWAKTGIHSTDTAEECRGYFNTIFPGEYNRLNSDSFHEFARWYRYCRKRQIQL